MPVRGQGLRHPLTVAKILIECGCSEEIVVAGVLHDTVEDTPITELCLKASTCGGG